MANSTPTSNGLQGVSIGSTLLSDVDGANGRLTICGYDIEQLAASKCFEDVAYLLLTGSLPSDNQREEFLKEIGAARGRQWEKRAQFQDAFRLKDPLDSLRAAVAMLNESDGFHATAVNVIAAIPLFIGGWNAFRNSSEMRSPIRNHDTATALMHGLGLNETLPEVTKALSVYLLTVSDHGMNASTFAARVIASTQSDAISAVTGAIGALKGPLHGGAPGPVLVMLDEIGEANKAADWIAYKLEAGERIMGMGHRIYQVRDPRAAVFEKTLQAMPPVANRAARLELARAVEREAERQLAARKPERPLKANVEFYTAVLLEACSIPGDLFTAVFAAGRVAGWLAHIKEQRSTGRLIRPTVEYVGAHHF